MRGPGPIVVISPHLDDAVLSMRNALARRPGSVVATLCTAQPDDPGVLSDWDARAGFSNGRHAMLTRREEDIAAMSALQAHPRHLGFLGQSYGNLDAAAVADAIELLLAEHSHLAAAGPLGIRHKDHVLIGAAFRVAAERSGRRTIWLYEDVPYRQHLQTKHRLHRVRTWWADGWRLRPAWHHVWHLGAGEAAIADQALHAYASQLAGLPSGSTTMRQVMWRADRRHRLRTP